ncbi:MAG TPA: alpha-N-acetylglucosaminidase [Ignavibacteriaceae bacterium]|nr:alpha-N-acetylglucosaminidase [Ignavibacteriaceae bacterium]
MKRNRLFIAVIILFFVAQSFSFCSVLTDNKQEINTVAIHNLIERIIPGRSSNFIIETLQDDESFETFEIENNGSKIVLRGNSSLAITKAFNWYLNNYCYTSVSWYLAEPIDVPSVLPPVEKKVKKTCRFEKRFFLNYCTFGYTMVWWQWEDWQRFIDWMALNGINMPLAITGQEYVWQKVWRKFGMTNEQISAFFTGPAHLPWHRMGNIDGWMGPLPQSFIDHQYQLQKKILERERSFGMTPILPAFAGHTPKAITNKYPGVKLTNMGSYSVGSRYDAYFIDPMEPLFLKIQKEFISEQTKAFGTDHYYGTDPFNEMDPPSWDADYLASVSRTIYKGLSQVDSQAVWVQMGWTFYYDRKHWTNPKLEAMIKAVPENKMMILDYFCEKTEVWRLTDGFFNAPYIWCYLGNFGGGTQMAAPLKKVAQRLTATEMDENRRQMVGIGSTLEGFGVNRFMFEWLFDYAWDSDAANTDEWITRYAKTRAGHSDPVAEDSWQRLLNLTYDQQVSGVGLGNTVEMRPRFEGNSHYTRRGEPYDYRKLADIFSEMLLADSITLSNPRYQYDLVMVCRQVLVNLAFDVRNKIFEAYKERNIKKFDKYTELFLNIASDVDRIVSTRDEFSFDKWLLASHKFESDDASGLYFEKNAKVLVTTWGQQGNYLIDYAARDFSGLINSFYKKRWEIYFDAARKCILDSTTIDQKKFDDDISEFEWQFCETPYKFKSLEKEDASKVARELYTKYVSYYGLLNAPTDKTKK